MQNPVEPAPKDLAEERLAYTVNDFCRAVGIGRTSVYELIKENKIKTVIIAGRRLVPAAEAQRLVMEGALSHDLQKIEPAGRGARRARNFELLGGVRYTEN